jgi:hypothetical protein
VYRSDSSSSSSPSSGSDSGDESEDEDDGPNEVVFLVYFCLFTIEEFARELLFLLDTVNDVSCVRRCLEAYILDHDSATPLGYRPAHVLPPTVEAEHTQAQLSVQAVPCVQPYPTAITPSLTDF